MRQPMRLSPGDRLGVFEIVALIGAGGMGEVYRARDTRLNRTVALKVMRPEWAVTETSRRRFDRESRVISQLNHPNICALYDVGTDGDRQYLVMEFVEGETLAARIQRGPIPPADVIRLGQAMASGLDAAHRQNVVHRDFKPSNVILSKSGIKILDFGLARAKSDEDAAPRAETRTLNTTEVGTVLGTLPYMAPEQLKGQQVDARADVFALGAVLHEMATGIRAFDAASQADLIAAVIDRDPPAASSLRPGVPALLDRVVSQCLSKDGTSPFSEAVTSSEFGRRRNRRADLSDADESRHRDMGRAGHHSVLDVPRPRAADAAERACRRGTA
jgi:eukaryotic-like serine/threonine-protein kinase